MQQITETNDPPPTPAPVAMFNPNPNASPLGSRNGDLPFRTDRPLYGMEGGLRIQELLRCQRDRDHQAIQRINAANRKRETVAATLAVQEPRPRQKTSWDCGVREQADAFGKLPSRSRPFSEDVFEKFFAVTHTHTVEAFFVQELPHTLASVSGWQTVRDVIRRKDYAFAWIAVVVM